MSEKSAKGKFDSFIVKTVAVLIVIIATIFWGISMLSKGVKYGYESGVRDTQNSAIEAGVGKWVINETNRVVKFVWITNTVPDILSMGLDLDKEE